MQLNVRRGTIFCCTLAAIAPVSQTRADGDKIAFPERYTDGVMYASRDLASEKEFREPGSPPRRGMSRFQAGR